MKTKFFSIVAIFLISFGLFGVIITPNLMASEIQSNSTKVLNDKDSKLIDPICSYSKKLVNSNKHIYYYHPDFKSKWWKVDEYNIGTSKN